MLKFLRKYQKWMLVVFCAGLMVAFTAQPVLELFMPQPGKRTMATTYGGEKITQELLQRTDRDMQLIRSIGMEPRIGVPLLPRTDNAGRDALAWILIQRAAEKNNLKASDQEAFNLVAMLLDAQDMDSLEQKAKDNNIGANAQYLMKLAREYLLAEQFRQLVSGIEYTKPLDDSSGSPGLRRIVASNDATNAIQQLVSDQNFQFQMQLAQMQGISVDRLLINELQQRGLIDRINGHARVTADEIRYALQQDFAQIDLTVALLDAEDSVDNITVDDAYVASIFERFAGDAPGTGQPYRLGYRIPNRVKLEAIRIPIDAARKVVADDITPEDIRNFYDNYRSSFIEIPTAPEGETPKPQRLTADQRDEIREILTHVNAQKKIFEIAQQARLKLNEDARGLEDDGPYKKLPDDFAPTPLVQIASEIEQEHGIAPEIIAVAELTSAREINESMQFTRTWVNELPTSTLRLPFQQSGFLRDQPLPQVVLGGKTGLFATLVPELSNFQTQQGFGLASYIETAKPFVKIDSPAANLALQPMLPGRILADETGSAYVVRITEADPAHPATDLAPIADKVREDAKKVKSYETLVEGKDALLTKAADVAMTAVTSDKDDIKTFSGLSRQSVTQQGGIRIEGVRNTGLILLDAFNTAEELLRSGGIDTAKEADRLFAVELAGDYKLAVVRLDEYRPMTRADFEVQAQNPSVMLRASSLTTPQGVQSAMSLEALMGYTEFEWAEGYSAESLLGEDDDEVSEDEDAESEEDEADAE